MKIATRPNTLNTICQIICNVMYNIEFLFYQLTVQQSKSTARFPSLQQVYSNRRNYLVFNSSMRLIVFMAPAVKDTMTKHVDEVVQHLLDNTDL